MEEFSKEDLDLLNEFSKEEGLHGLENEEIQVITAPNLKKMILKFESSLKNLIMDEEKKEKSFLSKKKAMEAKEASDQRKTYQKALGAIPTYLAFEKSKNPDIEGVYEKLINEITELGLDYTEYENNEALPDHDVELNDLEKEFGDELNELVGFEAPKPKPKPKPQPKTKTTVSKPSPPSNKVEEDDELAMLSQDLHGKDNEPIKTQPKQVINVETRVQVPIPVQVMMGIIENYKMILKSKVVDLESKAKVYMKNKQTDEFKNCLQLKITIEGELSELPPPEALKDLTEEDTPGIYERLSEHMKEKYQLNIDDLKPSTSTITLDPKVQETPKPQPKPQIVKPTSNITVQVIIQVVQNYKNVLTKRANEEMTKSKAFLANKDKQGATKCLQMKQIYLDEIETLPGLDDIKSFSNEDAPGIYERLGDHMKSTFKIDIKDLCEIPTSPMEAPKQAIKETPKADVISVSLIATIIENYKKEMLKRSEDEISKSKLFLKSGDKANASKCLQMKKIFLDEIGTLPGPDDLKEFTEEDTPGIYERLGDHMKKMFSINIDNLKGSGKDVPKPVVKSVKTEEKVEKLIHQAPKSAHTLQEVNKYQAIYKIKLEELILAEVSRSKEFLIKKDRENAMKCIQLKQLYQQEIDSLVVPVTDPDKTFASLEIQYLKFIGQPMIAKMDANRIIKIVENYKKWLESQVAHQMDLAKEFTINKDKESAKKCLLMKKEYMDEIATIPQEVFIKNSNPEAVYSNLAEHIKDKWKREIVEFENDVSKKIEQKPKKDLFIVQNVIKNGADIVIKSSNGTFMSISQKVEHVASPSDTCLIKAIQSGEKYVLKCGNKTLSIKDTEVRSDPEKLKPENQWCIHHQKGKFGIQGSNGNYLSLKKSLLFSSSSFSLVPEMGDKELFEVFFVNKVEDLLGLKLAFKTHHGTYMSASKDGAIEQKETLTKNEVFSIIVLEGKYALESVHKSCLMVEEDGKVLFSKGTAIKKVRFQMDILRMYPTNLIGFRLLRANTFLSARKGFFEKNPFTSVTNFLEWEMFSIETVQ